MNISFNEIEMTVLKAARGAGMEWGLAEEAAQAARWLAGFALPWAGPFLALFEAPDWHGPLMADARSLRPGSPEAMLCPIKAGAYLSDLGTTAPFTIERVRRPVLLLPFAARRSAAVALAWEGACFHLEEAAPGLSCADDRAIDPVYAKRVTLEPVSAALQNKISLWQRKSPTVDDPAWERLKSFESRTYVPASLRSRRQGAGPATQDND